MSIAANVNITLTLGSDREFVVLYKMSTADGEPSTPIDITGWTLYCEFSSGRLNYITDGGVTASTSAPLEGQIDVTISASAVHNLYLLGVRRYRIRMTSGGASSVILVGTVDFE